MATPGTFSVVAVGCVLRAAGDQGCQRASCCARGNAQDGEGEKPGAGGREAAAFSGQAVWFVRCSWCYSYEIQQPALARRGHAPRPPGVPETAGGAEPSIHTPRGKFDL